jgi:hypothetical protein
MPAATPAASASTSTNSIPVPGAPLPQRGERNEGGQVEEEMGRAPVDEICPVKGLHGSNREPSRRSMRSLERRGVSVLATAAAARSRLPTGRRARVSRATPAASFAAEFSSHSWP